MIELFGIPNCDTMKKARKWLDEQGVEYRFHDFKKEGIDARRLRRWADHVGWQTLLNRRGMMWRKLPQKVRDEIDEASALKIMLETPTIIKRPVLETGDEILVGFSEQTYRRLLDAPS